MRTCPLCGDQPRPTAHVCSAFSSVVFELGVCDTCRMGLVLNPRTDFADLYGPQYYAGRGADPLIDFESDERAGSVREIEWDGLLSTLSAIVRSRRHPAGTWRLLDWGAGLGGLVRRARARGIDADGLDQGYAATVLSTRGLLAPPPPERRERYDVVTAIEVVEHLLDPLAELRSMAECLKPGGFLFITTGNVARARVPLDRWYYAQIPDVHITFWSPHAWARALGQVGLEASPLPLRRVDPRIIQYKVIKALPRYRRPLRATLPAWRPATRFFDGRYGVSEFPIGVRPPVVRTEAQPAITEVSLVGEGTATPRMPG